MLEQDRIIKINIEEEMKSSYIDYSMSVIVSRALPDVRDGFKPVHRRILFGMMGLGNTSDKPYKKSARVVGEVLGKYHPHGDSSVYGALVRMAQPWAMRYMLVDGQGNYGSVDGDSAAAMRYTECRLQKIGEEMMQDLDKETVDMQTNFDDSLLEPTVMPTRIPNLLVNGASGIAVGMATNMPTHNLREVIDACVAYIDNNEIDVDGLMQYIKAPDFPTGGYIYGISGVRDAYETGRGRVVMRAKAEIESHPTHDKIVVTEIPYGVNKAELIKSIADLSNDKKIEGISNVNDETDREGMRIVIDIKRDANASVVLNKLYKMTMLQTSFGVNNVALVHGRPRLLNLKELIKYFVEHRHEVVIRRTRYDLRKAKERAHILEGLIIASDNIDEVIRIIRTSYDNAKERLMERFSLSDLQAQAILEMQLRRLQGLEKEKIDTEYAELQKKIAYYKTILADEKLLLGVIKDEITAIKEKYADERRTKLMQNPGEIDVEDLIEEETCVFTLSNLNYVKRTPLDTYKSQNRGGRGIIGMQTREEDFVKDLFLASTHDTLLFFTSRGKVYRMKGYEIPEAGRTARGVAIVNLLEIDADEKIMAVIPANEFREDQYLVMVTKQGLIKKTDMTSFANIRKSGLIALNLREEDDLISVMTTDGRDEIFVATRSGMGIKFSEEDVRPMGRTATGVKAITLKEDDYVVSAVKIDPEGQLLNVTENGYGKRTTTDKFNLQHRGGKGLKVHQLTEKTGQLTGVLMVGENDELMLITSEGVIIRLRGREISSYNRDSQGVKLMNLDDGVSVVGIAKISEEDIEEEAEETAAEAEKTEVE